MLANDYSLLYGHCKETQFKSPFCDEQKLNLSVMDQVNFRKEII